jgi:hypothetical protein
MRHYKYNLVLEVMRFLCEMSCKVYFKSEGECEGVKCNKCHHQGDY